MLTYMIITAHIYERKKFLEGYSQATAPLVEKYGGRYIMRMPGAECLEGSFGDGASMVISEWPDRAAVYAFWTSEAYQKAKALRDGIADCQVLVIDAPKFTQD